MILVLMGVSGAGKTTVGQRLADRLGWRFYDGDDMHPAANVAKMASGIPLADDERWPWLQGIRALVEELAGRGVQAVIACSALKAPYRGYLQQGLDDVHFVYLKGSQALIRARMAAREQHYMKADMLASQFEDLEEPRGVLTIDVSQSPEAIVDQIERALRSGGHS